MARNSTNICIILLLSLIWLVYPSISAHAQVQEVQVEKEGVGATKKDAIMDAIKEALTQVNGAMVAASTVSTIAESMRTQGEKVSYDSMESMSKSIATATKGLVNGYEILQLEKDPNLNDLFRARILVKIAKYKSSKQLKRLRVSVSKIFIKKRIANKSRIDFAGEVKEKLTDFLTQSRKFAVLDRQFQKETNAELNRIRGGGFKMEELARLGNRVGVDFLVLPTLNNQYIRVKKRKSKVSDKVFKSYDAFADLSIRVIDVATSQIKFSKNLTVRSTKSGRSNLINLTARNASDIILNAIFPPQVIELQKNLLIINQGGDTFAKGRRFNIVKLGKRLFDPVTKEFLGRDEEDAGIVEVVSVTDRMSKVKIIKQKQNVIQEFDKGVSFILRPKFGAGSQKGSKGPDIEKESKAIKKRIKKLKEKSKDDW